MRIDDKELSSTSVASAIELFREKGADENTIDDLRQRFEKVQISGALLYDFVPLILDMNLSMVEAFQAVQSGKELDLTRMIGYLTPFLDAGHAIIREVTDQVFPGERND